MRGIIVIFIAMIIIGIVLSGGCSSNVSPTSSNAEWMAVVSKKTLYAKSSDILSSGINLSENIKRQLREKSNEMAEYTVSYDIEKSAQDYKRTGSYPSDQENQSRYIKDNLSFNSQKESYSRIYGILQSKEFRNYTEIIVDSETSPNSSSAIRKFKEYKLGELIQKSRGQTQVRRTDHFQNIFLFWLLGPRFSYYSGYNANYWGANRYRHYPTFYSPSRRSYSQTFRSRRTSSSYRGGGMSWGK